MRSRALRGLSGDGDTIVLLLSGPNLNLLGEREPRSTAPTTLDDHVAARGSRRRAARRSSSSTCSRTTKANSSRRCTRRADDCAAIIINAGALTHYGWSLHDALAAFDGSVVEAAPVEPGRPRAVAPHVGGRAGRRRMHHGLRRRTATTWRSTPSRGCWRRDSHLPDDGRRRPAARLRAALRRRRLRRAARHQPHQRPVPHRVHRLGRAAARAARRRWCSSPTAATRSSRPSSCAAAGVEARIEVGNLAGPAATRCAAARTGRRPASASRPPTSRGRASAPSPASGSPDAELVATEGLVEELRRVKDDGEIARIEPRRRASPTTRWPTCAPLLADGLTEAEFALALDFEIRRLGASGQLVRDDRGVGPERRQAARRARRIAGSSRASSSSSTSAPSSTATART